MANAWSATDKTARATLSNNNTTITADASTNDATAAAARLITGIASGTKRYYEIVATQAFVIDAGATKNSGYGLSPSSYVLTGDSLGFDSAHATLSLWAQDGVFWNGNWMGLTATNGDAIRWAVDLVNNKLWIAVNGGNWNNSGTDNPATNTGGISLPAAMQSVTLYPTFQGYRPNLKADLTTTAFTYAAPSGFDSFTLADRVATVSVTEAADTLAAAATVTVSGTVAATDAEDLASITGAVLITGNVAATDSGDIMSVKLKRIGWGPAAISAGVWTPEHPASSTDWEPLAPNSKNWT